MTDTEPSLAPAAKRTPVASAIARVLLGGVLGIVVVGGFSVALIAVDPRSGAVQILAAILCLAGSLSGATVGGFARGGFGLSVKLGAVTGAASILIATGSYAAIITITEEFHPLAVIFSLVILVAGTAIGALSGAVLGTLYWGCRALLQPIRLPRRGMGPRPVTRSSDRDSVRHAADKSDRRLRLTYARRARRFVKTVLVFAVAWMVVLLICFVVAQVRWRIRWVPVTHLEALGGGYHRVAGSVWLDENVGDAEFPRGVELLNEVDDSLGWYHLSLSTSRVTGAALSHLQEIHKRDFTLALSNTQLDDAGLKNLSSLDDRSLQLIVIGPPTEVDSERIRTALPHTWSIRFKELPSHPESTPPARLEETLDFGVYWPPQDPESPQGPAGQPLLLGQLRVRQTDSPQADATHTVSIQLTRPHDEEHRETWNARLAYREYDWMRRVRVWDVDEKWLWPNLPYLLRVHGKDRVERYGGIDPGKGVDNDFAAVLIRACDATGEAEKATDDPAPLVSAQWYPVGVKDIDRQTIVHTARSDDFILSFDNSDGTLHGRFAVWLIYADFMGAPSPRTWPEELEWAGGILAYFEIDRHVDSSGHCQLNIQQKTPTSATGFDWATWVEPPDAEKLNRATPRLSSR